MKLFVTIMLLSCFSFVKAQDITLKGRVISDNLGVLPQVKITNNKDELLATSDIEGRFEVSLPMQTFIFVM